MEQQNRTLNRLDVILGHFITPEPKSFLIKTQICSAPVKKKKTKINFQKSSEEWNCSVSDVKKAFKTTRNRNLKVSPPIIPYLIVKGIQDKEKRQGSVISTRYTLLLKPPNKRWKDCRARLNCLLKSQGDITSDTVPKNVQSFEEAMLALPKWTNQDTYIFHLDKNIPIVQRCQKSGLCYIHAPEVVQHYLVAINNKEAGMIDMAKMIRMSFDKKTLEKHIFKDAGGDSRRMLLSILMPGSVVFGSDFSDALTCLKKYGPGLIHQFTVFEDFYNSGKLSFDGKPCGEVIGYHAMVLIGVREENNKLWFLLQNWWPSVQFVEASEEYLNGCESSLIFVKNPQTEIPKKWPVQNHMYAENENLDKPENVAGEDPPCPVPK
ncbi:cathepsin B-like cysteine proteinase [Acrasis kona]|uniref:Cathepsin B-like cysteine proteinase n=1 Tax=Acrasis kona TaxID=1008807 RepID=A0AAW2ZCY7_9EUKA